MFDSLDDFASDHEWDQADNMVTEAFELYEQGRHQQALERLTVAIESGPEHGEWYFNAALALDGMEEYDKAIEFFERALELNPDDLEILNCLGVDYTRTAQYDLALYTFDRIEFLDAAYEPAYCNRIITHTEMEQYDKAEQMFYLAQQINPDCALCFYNIGNSLFSQGQYERAIWCWEKCAELDPGHPQIHLRLAQACWVSGRGERARKEFIIELRGNSADIDVILDFGLYLLESGDLESAKEKFNRILEFEEEHAVAHFYLAEIHRMRGHAEQAVRLYRKAAHFDPQLPGPRYRLARICAEGGEFKKGIELLRQELRLGIDDIDVLKAMGWLFMQMDADSDAGSCFLQVLEQAEADDSVFYGLGMSLAVGGEYESAAQCLRHAIRLNRTNPELLICAAWLSCKMKEWTRAYYFAVKCQIICKGRQPWLKHCRQIKKSAMLHLAKSKIRRFFTRKS
ncbi:MAG: tetratricopeptide repeat protein [Planctomycetota bacterium]|jgi:tetratricopeptide (TPR) repeat protein